MPARSSRPASVLPLVDLVQEMRHRVQQHRRWLRRLTRRLEEERRRRDDLGQGEGRRSP